MLKEVFECVCVWMGVCVCVCVCVCACVCARTHVKGEEIASTEPCGLGELCVCMYVVK